eukprot:TRINITY_DN77522_c0_g1_i1.p1 TRINITY_DN77522_c0_g1~~TRINITY_DN77522_c0_g1_i1.p1  ORF type:complete len:993 (+),score=166.14 TRINITY_DN77522_c0_g1_i1:61-3039(+)
MAPREREASQAEPFLENVCQGSTAEQPPSEATEVPQPRPRQRRVVQRERQAFRDRLFQQANINGLSCREFEIDLLAGEKLCGEPIRVRLTKTISFCRRLFFTLITFGLYEVWHRCCARGSRIFDVDSRIAVTSLGRLLLWTHSACGGGLPLGQHCLRALTKPSSFAYIVLVVLFIVFGPETFETDILQVYAAVAAVVALAALSVFWQWLFERSRLQAQTSIRQFEAKELSHVRLVCARQSSLFGLGGEMRSCQVNMSFGAYPKEQQLRRTLPAGVYDTGTVRAGFIPVGQPMDSGSGLDSSKLQTAAGQGGSSPGSEGFVATASAVLIILAFAGFINEVIEFASQWVHCVVEDEDRSISSISACIGHRFRAWWSGDGKTSFPSVAGHWIEAIDWSLQLLLFVYVVGPTASFLWKTLSEQSGAGIGFVVDRRLGASTEDERFDDHWLELASFISDLFEGACKEDPKPAEGDSEPRRSLGAAIDGVRVRRWEEVPGDVLPDAAQTASPEQGSDAAHSNNAPAQPNARHDEASGASASQSARLLPKPSWSQVEEMISHLIDPTSGKVRVYRSVLSFLEDEEVLAVYPEKIILPLAAKVKIVFTCGLEYYLHWRRQRREGAIILTNKRLIHVSVHFSRYNKTMKVDMYTLGQSVKYVGLTPPRWQACSRPKGTMAIATRLGTFEISLLQMKRLRDSAQRLWQGLVSLQDTVSVSAVELSDWVTVLTDATGTEGPEDGDPELVVEAVQERKEGEEEEEEEARREADALWGDDIGDDTGNSPGEEASPADNNGVLAFSANRAEKWGLVLAPGERPLWGPCLFEEEVMRACCPQRHARRNRKKLSALVTFTDRRFIVIQYRSVGPLCCGGVCHRSPVDSVCAVPLKCVLGFTVQETFSLQQSMIVRKLSRICCRPLSESTLVIKVLSNAGLGKVYLESLSVRQRVLPINAEPACNFEEDKVIELRRWLGNIALFFTATPESQSKPAIELWRCDRGWAPD